MRMGYLLSVFVLLAWMFASMKVKSCWKLMIQMALAVG
jgi:hypothetical protein